MKLQEITKKAKRAVVVVPPRDAVKSCEFKTISELVKLTAPRAITSANKTTITAITGHFITEYNPEELDFILVK